MRLIWCVLGLAWVACGDESNTASPERDHNFQHWQDSSQAAPDWTMVWVDNPEFRLVYLRGKGTDRVVVERTGSSGGKAGDFYVMDGSLIEPKFEHATPLPDVEVQLGERLALRETEQVQAGERLSSCGHEVIACAALGFGISNSSGEAVWLLNAEHQVLDRTAYPGGLVDGQCWLRREQDWVVASCSE